ncbi:uncharacterized protein PG998_004855 [Apiospora kogelbergensis]|uniref:uncharacterized protein n=1 Tax=Apiospora kogelbergensis TaxID=1337665 RepID=UPI00312F867D
MATVTVKEKDGALTSESQQSSGPGDKELQSLNASLEAFSQQKKSKRRRRKRPFLMLVAVLLLFLVSGGGVALAILLFLNPSQAEHIGLARDLVLVASAMSLLYTAIHVRGAFTNYINDAPHIPPHFRGGVHARQRPYCGATWDSNLDCSRRGDGPAHIQVGTPLGISFIALAGTINKNPTPFALAGISSSWLLTYQDSNVFVDEDNDDAFVSISRRASMQRAALSEKRTTPPLAPSPPPALARSTTEGSQTSRRMTLTEEALAKAETQGRRGPKPNNLNISRVADEDDAKTELMANSPVRPNYYITPPPLRNSVPPVPPLPAKLKAKAKGKKSQRHTLAPSRNGGDSGGGWRDDWNSLADQTGVRPKSRSNSSSDGGQRTYTMSSSTPSSTGSAAPMLSTRQLQQQHQLSRPGTSSSHYSTASRSQFSSVQYPTTRASGVMWRPPMRPGSSYQRPGSSYSYQQSPGQDQQRRVLRHSPSSSLDSTHSHSSSTSSTASSLSSRSGSMTLRTPKPIAGLRAGIKRTTPGPAPVQAPPPLKQPKNKLRRKPSNFSRPITPSDGLSNNGVPRAPGEFV